MAETKPKTDLIYKKIPAVMADIGSISKDKRNKAQGYSFRGIDDVYNEIHDVLTKHKVFTIPQVIATHHEERKSKSGGVLIYRIYTIKYTFYAEDGSHVEAVVVGEGMDSGDKAGNKALSVAHKYALIQVFAIPTEEPKDPEHDNHQLSGNGRGLQRAPQDEGDLADLASDPHENNAEKNHLIDAIRKEVESAGIHYVDFKAYLYRIQDTVDPKRSYAGKKFGNTSLTEGKLDDLKHLKERIGEAIDGFKPTQANRGAEDEQPGLS